MAREIVALESKNPFEAYARRRGDCHEIVVRRFKNLPAATVSGRRAACDLHGLASLIFRDSRAKFE
jgi:hypothetical protein